MSEQVVADVPGVVYAYRDGALLVIARGPEVSPFGPAFEPVRNEMDGRCTTLGYRGPNVGREGQPAWLADAEVTVYKVWAECPPYEHDCAREVRCVAG
ncbi:hypothetical protein [Amycolatopsis sp. NPDC003731]